MAGNPDLASQRCVACRGGVPPLSDAERARLLPQVPGWRVQEGVRLERRFKCRNFAEALDLVNRIGALAEAEGHHPDLSFGWGYVIVSLQTHAIGGLHANDFILAAKIDRLVAAA